jgi:peptidoglycan/LPS O-acetylase OafA/YrhL
LLFPASLYSSAGKAFERLATRPVSVVVLLLILGGAAFIPLSLSIGQYTWTGFGPFDFQLNRVLFYLAFFMVGAVLGAFAWEKHLFAGIALLKRNPGFWIAIALTCFVFVQLMVYRVFGEVAGLPENIGQPLFLLAFTASAIFTSLAFFAVFRTKLNIISASWKSLSSCAYGIYLLHYPFICWFQFALLKVNLPFNHGVTVVFKFSIVFLLSLICSWYLTSQLKKSVTISRFI